MNNGSETELLIRIVEQGLLRRCLTSNEPLPKEAAAIQALLEVYRREGAGDTMRALGELFDAIKGLDDGEVKREIVGSVQALFQRIADNFFEPDGAASTHHD